ncbi:MAG: hypothetical protein Kow0042_22160 [Calditrichia bacterium]
MKTLIVVVLLSVLCFGKITAGDEVSPVVKPNEKFKNNTQEILYLAGELSPGSEFVNNSNLTFRVMKKTDFFRYNYLFDLEAKIEKHRTRAWQYRKELQESEAELKKLFPEYQKLKHQD